MKEDFETIESRLKARKGHCFKRYMLVTQFSTLEEPGAEETDVVAVDIRQSIDEVVSATVGAIKDAIN